MIIITGDMHANFSRFNSKKFPELGEDDYVIICGDFGGIWDNSPREIVNLDRLAEKPFTTLFVSGNHENFDMLKMFPVEKWNGGDVQFIRKNIIHLTRGQVFTLEGKTFFTMGGASSHDIQDGILEPDDPEYYEKCAELDRRLACYRVNHYSWWAEELPSDEEYETALANLEQHNWKVDYIISHCCPTSVLGIIGRFLYKSDRLTDFFEDVKERCEFDRWYFGHYHINQVVNGKYVALADGMEVLF